MSIFHFFSGKKPFFTKEENDVIVRAIQDAERQTSGEIRVFIESRCKYVEPLDRAAEIFTNLKMGETQLRNGVLFYMAVKDRQLAIYADKGIHDAAGAQYWQETIKNVINVFSKTNIVEGITLSITKIGAALKTHFPYDAKVDKNELPDEVIFGH